MNAKNVEVLQKKIPQLITESVIMVANQKKKLLIVSLYVTLNKLQRNIKIKAINSSIGHMTQFLQWIN